ncbi:hypothetical protein [Bacillus sp. TH30]|uniref:hypothetical protein n=1 Tax=Bacillus sp. TH30 TaxID=2796395 RepID=UPI001913A2D2|nr:hypothetical protein [Bacillus sp. TH30]MBK5424390.1 hypothetical protein [Bacillus sp. TH30]
MIEILQNIKFSLDNPKYFGEFEKKKHIKESIRILLDDYTVNKEKKNLLGVRLIVGILNSDAQKRRIEIIIYIK